MFDQAGIDAKILESRILSEWKDIAGDFLFREASPESVRDGVLTLRVGNTVLGGQLKLLEDEITGRINRYLGKETVSRIRVRVGPVSLK